VDRRILPVFYSWRSCGAFSPALKKIIGHDGKLWQIIDEGSGPLGSNILSAYQDREGALWLGLDAGEVALETIRNEQPDLVFLDVMTPKKNGFDVCDEVKNELG
jgi:hypothetical protein